MGKDITTIQISKETKKILMMIGHKGETYDQLIRRLIKQVYGEQFIKDDEHPQKK